jgi:hypothetical protein
MPHATVMAVSLVLTLATFSETRGAAADWRPIPVNLPPEPARKLLAVDKGLLVLQARQLTLVSMDGRQSRRAYVLRMQNDGLVDVIVDGAQWWLASRRQIWSSDDAGHTWRPLVTLTPRDTNEWLALTRVNGNLIAASRDGTRRIEPGSATPWGAAANAPTRQAFSDAGALMLETHRGLSLLTKTGTLRRLPHQTLRGLRAFAYYDNGEIAVADATQVYLCTDECDAEILPEVEALSVNDEGFWAATTDSVFFTSRSEQERYLQAQAERGLSPPESVVSGVPGVPEKPAAGSQEQPVQPRAGWVRRDTGLGAATPQALEGQGRRAWVATAQGLFAWENAAQVAEAQPPGAGEQPRPIHPLNDFRRGPPMAAVRQWTLDKLLTGGDPIASWKKRVRWRGAAPRMALSFRRKHDTTAVIRVSNTIGISTSESRMFLGPDNAAVNEGRSAGYDYGVSLTWNLDDLVYDNRELGISNEMEDLYKLRRAVILDVTRLYYDRLRVLTDLGLETDPRKQILLELRLEELTADMDFFTDGRFSDALARGAP